MVALENYQYRYPDGTRALNGIDLTFNAGDRMAIVGENGAGKSTLLSCLLGVRQGTGTFRLRRTAGDQAFSAGVLWRQVGMVFQDCADQLFCPSVEDEIAFGLRRLGLPAGEIGRRVRDALETVRLRRFVARRVPLHLSGGERKRLALACVLAMKPGLLILDEPTAGLDPEGEALLLDILSGLEATLLLVSHDVYFVGELTRRILVMHRGRIVEDLPVGDFLRTERLGHLNGLAFTYRRRCTETIRRLQHLHEHTHPHLHLHEHPHRHGDEAHAHPHAHTHEHPHRFAHRHPGRAGTHAHVSHRLHDHDHPGHDAEAHDHDHGVTGQNPILPIPEGGVKWGFHTGTDRPPGTRRGGRCPVAIPRGGRRAPALFGTGSR